MLLPFGTHSPRRSGSRMLIHTFLKVLYGPYSVRGEHFLPQVLSFDRHLTGTIRGPQVLGSLPRLWLRRRYTSAADALQSRDRLRGQQFIILVESRLLLETKRYFFYRRAELSSRVHMLANRHGDDHHAGTTPLAGTTWSTQRF